MYVGQWGERGAYQLISFDGKSFGNFCEVGHHVKDVTLGNVIIFAEELRILQKCGSLVLQEER